MVIFLLVKRLLMDEITGNPVRLVVVWKRILYI